MKHVWSVLSMTCQFLLKEDTIYLKSNETDRYESLSAIYSSDFTCFLIKCNYNILTTSNKNYFEKSKMLRRKIIKCMLLQIDLKLI